MAKETPEEEARLNRIWLGQVGRGAVLCVAFITAAWVFSHRKPAEPIDWQAIGDDLGATALGLGGILLTIGLAVALGLGALWVVVRVIRSAWRD